MKILNIIKDLFTRKPDAAASMVESIQYNNHQVSAPTLRGLKLEQKHLIDKISQTNNRLEDLANSIPKYRTCCNACWLSACCPEFDRLIKKQERRQARLSYIEKKLNE